MAKVKSNELKTKNACLTRRSHMGVPRLRGATDYHFWKSVKSKQILLNALLARAIRQESTVEKATEVYECVVQPGWLSNTTEDEKYLVSLLVKLEKSTKSVMGVEPEAEDIAAAIKEADQEGYVEETLLHCFESLDFPTIFTARAAAKETAAQINRYLEWESRTPVFPEPKVLNIFGQDVEVAPDVVFNDGWGEIEVTKFRFRKPDVTQTGNKRDTSAKYNLELYSFWRYGESMAEQGKATEVTSTFTFMRRADDSSDSFHPTFRDPKDKGGKNIIFLTQATNNDGVYQSEFHDRYKRLMEDFLLGTSECSGENCTEACDFYRLCQYKHTPKLLEDKFNKKPLSEIELTEEQSEAIAFRKGIARINAGAGAGKTLVMALSVATMLEEGIDVSKILCVTFTNAGADELSERIKMYANELGVEDDASVLCTTFNGFGNKVIQEKYEDLGYSQPPVLVDEIERKDLIAKLLRENFVHGLDYQRFDCAFPHCKGALEIACIAFDLIKHNGAGIVAENWLHEALEEHRGCIKDPRAYQELITLYEQYDAKLRNSNLIEYVDQENCLLDLLAGDPYLLEDFGYEYILVDEFQDSSDLQMQLLREFASCKCFKGLIVAGDDSQSIFSFRGAVPENIINFFDKLGVAGENTADFSIVENHRSTPEILDFANKVNEKNRNRVLKSLTATREHGLDVQVKGFHNTADEYAFICEQVKQRLESGIKPEDIAVFAATRSELLTIASKLVEENMNVILLCPEPMLENSNVQAAIALCSALKDPYDTESIAVYLNAIKNGTLLDAADEAVAKEITSFSTEILEKYMTANPSDRMSYFKDLLAEIDPFDQDSIYADFRKRLDRKKSLKAKREYARIFKSYGGEAMKRPGKYPGIVLSTVHSAKGLEWPIVFTSLTKFETKPMSAAEEEERRRLEFVAATRARDELIITGKYVAYRRKVNEFDKKATEFHNRYLKEAFEILGLPYDPVDHEKEEREAAKRAFNKAKRRKKIS